MSADKQTADVPSVTAVQVDEVEVALAGRVACPWCAGLSRPGPSCDTCGSPLDEQEAIRLTEEFRDVLESRLSHTKTAEEEAELQEAKRAQDEAKAKAAAERKLA